jgi:hypothetical protein
LQKPKKRKRRINQYLDNPPDAVFERSVTIRIYGKPVQWRHTFKQSMIEDNWFGVNGELSAFKVLFNPPSFIIKSNYPRLQPLLYDLGIPEDPTAIYYSWFLRGGDYSKAKGEAHRRAQGFTVECFGKLLNSGFGQDLERQLFQRSEQRVWSDSIIEDVGVWRTRVYRESIADLDICAARPMSPPTPEFPYLESKWDQCRNLEVLRMGGFESYAGCFTTLKEFYKRTANILMKSPVRFGRHPLDPMEFYETVVRACHEIWIEEGEKPGQAKVALKLNISDEVFDKRWGKTFARWADIPPPPNLSKRR